MLKNTIIIIENELILCYNDLWSQSTQLLKGGALGPLSFRRIMAVYQSIKRQTSRAEICYFTRSAT